MKFFESIKNYFAPGYDKSLVNPDEDARILASIAKETMFLNARDGINYYYYFAKSEQDTGVAKYLMVRNGVNVKKHRSLYYYKPRLALRIKTSVLDKSISGRDFVESIDASTPFSDFEELKNKLDIARNQMNGKVK